MECLLNCSALKRKEVLTHATISMNLETIILSERNQTYKTTCCMIPFIGNIQNKQVHKTESILVVARGQESGWGGNGDNLMAIGFLWGKFEISGISDDGCTTL